MLDLVLDDLVDESVIETVDDDGVALEDLEQLGDESSEGAFLGESHDVRLSFDRHSELLQLLVGEVHVLPGGLAQLGG